MFRVFLIRDGIYLESRILSKADGGMDGGLDEGGTRDGGR